MAELLITSSLDPIKEGQVFSKGLPRHVTIWQYFELPDFHLNEFITEAGNAIEGFSPLEIVGADDDMFGERKDTPVRRVQALGHGATIFALHATLGAVIERYEGVIEKPEWAYAHYNPHITYVDGKALEENEREVLTTVELVEKKPNSKDKIIRKVWQLEEA